MQRHSQIFQTKVNAKVVVTALVFVFLLLFVSVLSCFAVDPPPSIGVTPISTGAYLGQFEGYYAFGLANLQSKYGSFNTYVPVLGWWNGDGFYLAISQKDSNGEPYFKPVDTASQWLLSADSEHQMYMLRLAENGFGLQQRLYQFETAAENVWGRYDDSLGFVYNMDFYSGTGGSITVYAEAYYNKWLRWSTSTGGGTDVGTGGGTVIVETLDIGSIISALPKSAKSIIDGAFGFEIFGINVAGTLTAILVVAIVGFIVKWLLSLKS